MRAAKQHKTHKATRIAVLSLIKLSGAPMPRQIDQTKMFGCGQSDSCRDQDDIEEAIALLKQTLSQSDIIALLKNIQTAVAVEET